QSAFRGSLREARGAILRKLSRQKGGLGLGDICADEDIDADRLEKASAGLLAEGLIRKDGERYFLG
ncbi:MAG: A/G-specific adenine glycosylase, partial [Treponema sp.]|nr:A/G-specific adenine glycosylase [Treponema sp.]